MKRFLLITGFTWGVVVSHIHDKVYLIASCGTIGFAALHLMIVGMKDSKCPDTGHQ